MEPLIHSVELIKLIDEVIQELKNKDVRALKNGDLHDYIDQVQIKLAGLHNELAESYFLKPPEVTE